MQMVIAQDPAALFADPARGDRERLLAVVTLRFDDGLSEEGHGRRFPGGRNLRAFVPTDDISNGNRTVIEHLAEGGSPPVGDLSASSNVCAADNTMPSPKLCGGRWVHLPTMYSFYPDLVEFSHASRPSGRRRGSEHEEYRARVRSRE